VEAAYYPEQKPALAHTPAIKKEAKVKVSFPLGYINIPPYYRSPAPRMRIY
jgi:hypothetical protein